MANPQLIDYIRREIATGIAKDEIIKVLATTGWQQDAIQEAFAEISVTGASPAAVRTPSTIVTETQPVLKKNHLWLWIGVGVAVLILGGLGVFAAYAFGLFSSPSGDTPPPISTATTTLPVATSTPVDQPLVATTTATTTLPIVSPVVSTTSPISITPIVCTTQDCLAANFATCTLASFITDTGVLTSSQYKILGIVTGGCSMSFTYTKNINPAWANKSMTCVFNNKLEFKASVENTFALALSGKSSCEGPLATILKSLPKQ